jgi:hypothetical protein
MAARTESRPVRTPVNRRRHAETNRARAHLYLVVPGSARLSKKAEARDFPLVTTPVARKHDAGIWTLLLVLGLTLMAAAILWANISGSLF